ncbi:MAG TPA: YbdD/YjiX family protein [Gemmatimonadaceae bacterium]|nr:YbdD/YjiX family protein [Gemmatimonadaceae bacterium]
MTAKSAIKPDHDDSSPLSALAAAIRAILGAPDYERYVAYARQCHPERELISLDDFVKERMETRYEKPGARCC